MAQFKFISQLIIENLDNSRREINTVKTVSFTAKIDEDFAISASGTKTLWDPTTDASEAASDFDFLYLKATGTVDIEFTCNEGHASEELFTMRLLKDSPLILFADDAYYGHSASNAFGGTLDVIDKIRAKEPNGTAVTVTMILGT